MEEPHKIQKEQGIPAEPYRVLVPDTGYCAQGWSRFDQGFKHWLIQYYEVWQAAIALSATIAGLDSPDITQLDAKLWRQMEELRPLYNRARQEDEWLVRPGRFGLPDEVQSSSDEPSIFPWFDDYLNEAIGLRITWNGFLAWRWEEVARKREELKQKQKRLESWKRSLSMRSEAVRSAPRYLRITERMEAETRQLQEQEDRDQLRRLRALINNA